MRDAEEIERLLNSMDVNHSMVGRSLLEYNNYSLCQSQTDFFKTTVAAPNPPFVSRRRTEFYSDDAGKIVKTQNFR